MQISPQTPAQSKRLYQVYLQCEPAQKNLLKVLALVYNPISQPKLVYLLGLLDANGLADFGDVEAFLSAATIKQLTQVDLISQNIDGIKINRLVANQISQDCADNGEFDQLIRLAEQVMPVTSSYQWQGKSKNEQRLLRDFYFLKKWAQFERLLAFNQNPQIIDIHKNQILIELFFSPFKLEIFLALPNSIQYQSFATWFRVRQMKGGNIQYPLELLEEVYQANPSNSLLKYLLAEQYLLSARFAEFQALIPHQDASCYGLQLIASFLFLTGHFEQATGYFNDAIKAKNKFVRRKKQYLNGVSGVFYKLCLLMQANQIDDSYYELALEQINFERLDKNSDAEYLSISEALTWTIKCLASGKEYLFSPDRFSHLNHYDLFSYHLIQLNFGLSKIWCQGRLDNEDTAKLAQSQTCFNSMGLALFVKLSEQVLNWPKIKKSDGLSQLINFPEQINQKADWELALDKLIALKQPTEAESEQVSGSESRLVWELEFDRYHAKLSAKEQKKSATGWTKGRVISLKRLYHEASTFHFLTEQDLQICQAINLHQSWGYQNTSNYVLEGASALLAAANAANLFVGDDPDNPIELTQKEPELLVNQQGEQLCLSIADLPDRTHGQESPYSIFELSPGHYAFTLFNQSHLKVVDIIGEEGLLIPIHAKDKALKSISAIAPLLNIQSDLNELDTGLAKVACDPHLVINIQPFLDGLAFTCVVMPFGEKGPVFKPAIGNVNLTTEIDGKRIATQRDLIKEQNLLDQLDQVCPEFLAMPGNILNVEDSLTALDTLQQLEQVVKQNAEAQNSESVTSLLPLTLRWPKGKKLKLSNTLTSEQLQLAVNKKNEWFDISGELKVDEQQVIDLKKLLELISQSNGKYIRLDSEQILTLSQELQAKLSYFNQITDEGKFHPLASFQIADATQGMRLKTIHAWDEQTKKMHESNQIMPLVPATLKAELRDYQREGFEWMARLAHWGAGACLADDMGLGKTLQALAMLLRRAKDGPSLVIAPTSVCFNWQQEAAKFAPSLKIKLFADASDTKQRQTLLNNLKPSDCVIISYGLLQRESDLLKHVRWHTIVADEAQALKNPLSKRTKAAYNLKANFKLITTGTPIENDLTELWSLFRFVNPGLLGNLKTFGRRFALPIANVKEDKLAAHKASKALKHLIQPFILRRMKNQVLTELPPRTEINIQVELSDKEQAFYEALRQTAIDNVSNDNNISNTGEQRIKMLAELVKLRQACCHPALIFAETDLPSAKLNALDELLTELQQNKHKALIFSQFVGHLKLIQKHLEYKGIQYQYLDGSTPQKERQKRVNAFQLGEGEVFLISLKAGGFGLNLTAADYVIHMDPWWNPAVEEQASDRVHRMGQDKPVTIYRLIAKNTIEEKIVDLHKHKRDLADKLLSGNEQASKLSVDEMLSLLKDTF